MPQNVTITLFRLGKPARVYTEGFVTDDGSRLQTHSIVPEAFRARWSGNWQRAGLIPAGRTIAAVSKHLFYREYFAVMTLRDDQNELLGHYCDIVTPLKKRHDGYRLTDLCLDLWIFPDRRVYELDWDEFEAAVQEGLMTSRAAAIARRTMTRLTTETAAGVFPEQYIR